MEEATDDEGMRAPSGNLGHSSTKKGMSEETQGSVGGYGWEEGWPTASARWTHMDRAVPCQAKGGA